MRYRIRVDPTPGNWEYDDYIEPTEWFVDWLNLVDEEADPSHWQHTTSVDLARVMNKEEADYVWNRMYRRHPAFTYSIEQVH